MEIELKISLPKIETWLKEEFKKVEQYYLEKHDYYNLGYLHALLELNQFIRKEKEKILNIYEEK